MSDKRPQLLLVEEDDVLADVTAFRLELLGYGVARACSGQSALQALDEALPDLIILDSYLPDVDGVELVEQLSSEPRTSTIPILVFSTDANLNAVQRSVSSGAKDYLVTPYDPAVLEQKIEQLLDISQTTS